MGMGFPWRPLIGRHGNQGRRSSKAARANGSDFFKDETCHLMIRV